MLKMNSRLLSDTILLTGFIYFATNKSLKINKNVTIEKISSKISTPLETRLTTSFEGVWRKENDACD